MRVRLPLTLSALTLLLATFGAAEERTENNAPPVSAPAGHGVPSTLFSFRADKVPIKEALALFARANHLNIVPDLDIQGDVTVEFQDLPLDVAMQALLDASGYYFV